MKIVDKTALICCVILFNIFFLRCNNFFLDKFYQIPCDPKIPGPYLIPFNFKILDRLNNQNLTFGVNPKIKIDKIIIQHLENGKIRSSHVEADTTNMILKYNFVVNNYNTDTLYLTIPSYKIDTILISIPVKLVGGCAIKDNKTSIMIDGKTQCNGSCNLFISTIAK